MVLLGCVVGGSALWAFVTLVFLLKKGSEAVSMMDSVSPGFSFN